MKWSRRQALQAVGVFLTLAKAKSSCAALYGSGEPSADGFAFSTLFESPQSVQSAAAVGRVFFRCTNNSWGRPDLILSITHSIQQAIDQSEAKALESYDRPALRRLIADAVANDFSEGNILNVDGWLLAKTEVHLCALVRLERLD